MEDVLTSVDRISNLSNKVLNHILSFMSTKEAAPTCILSKRWNNIWAQVPCLKFDSAEFVPENCSRSHLGNRDAKFIQFINGVLRHRGTTPLDKFELIYGSTVRIPHPAMEWVDHIVVNCKPRVLSLDILLEDNFDMPDSVFSCASLEEMVLMLCSEREYNYVCLPEKIYLPSLKKFRLSGAMLVDGFVKKLFSGSCLLEKLVLDCCQLVSTLQISSTRLKHFAITNCDQCFAIQVSAPSLVYLDIQCNETGKIILKNLRSLVNARVRIYGRDLYSAIPGNLKHISALANATTLDLALSSVGVKEIFEKELYNFPTFINLKTLAIGPWCMVKNFDLVAAFLEHSPNLEELTLFHVALFEKDEELICAKHRGLAEKTKKRSVDLLVKQLRDSVSTIGEIKII